MSVNPKRKIALLSTAAMLLLAGTTNTLHAQTNLEVFGQNRIQYRNFDWKYFETKHFRIYHYDAAGRQLARYVAEQVENDISVVQKKLGGEFPRKFNIILYNNYDEYRQTNIGKRYESQLTQIPAGTVDLVGDKLVVYFNGEHSDLRRQTREGMARVIMERMLFGESFREMVKSAVLMNLPKWVVYGFTSYLVDGWDTKSNSDWENALAAHPNAGFYEQAEINPELAGKAFWKYISDKYGETTMKTLLYNMQRKSNLNDGIKLTLNQKTKVAYDSTIAYYKGVYAEDNMHEEKPDTASVKLVVNLPHDGTQIRNFKVAPKGNDVAYVAWKNGEYKVYLQNTHNEQSRYAILEEGRLDYNESPDPDYPLLAWSNTGYKLAILYKKGRETRLRIYNSIKARVENYLIPANRFDRVLSMTFNEDDDKLVFSAIKKSQTDLYEFTIRGSRMVNITNDQWDDLQPWFVSGGSRRGVLFLSNRPAPNLNVQAEVNQLPTGPMNVFFYNTRTKRKELIQMSHVTSGSVSQPIQYGSENYAYLYDENGIRNQFVVTLKRNAHNMDSAIAVPVTNYTTNVINHQYNPASREAAHVVQDGDRYIVYYQPLQIPGQNAEVKTLTPTILSQTEAAKTNIYSAPVAGAAKADNISLLKKGNTFKSEFENDTATGNIIAPEATSGPVEGAEMGDQADSTFLKMKAQPYRLAFKPDFFSVKVDNSILFNRYQSYSEGGGKYTTPPLGGMVTLSLNDLMENYRLTGGIRLPVNLSGLTFFTQYENFKHRLDWGILYLRTENYNNYLFAFTDVKGNPIYYVEELGKVVTNMVQGSFSYPLDRIRSVRLQLGLRTDRLLFKAQDTFSLTFDPTPKNQFWGLSRLEYVFDNTINPTINIYNGFRYKIFGEYFSQLNNGGGTAYNLGVDFRYYARIYKNFIWAARLAAASSGGTQKILYHVGGVDNWIGPKYSDYVPVRPYENYGFETIATNLRGYELNSRNGNSYGVINTEFRLPLVTTFAHKPIQSSVLKNLQLVAFADAGSAWQGTWPNADRLRNNKTLPDPRTNPNASVVLNITDETGGFGVGYGAGLRTMLFGYFIRTDAAWNIDGRTKPILYVSIGTDF